MLISPLFRRALSTKTRILSPRARVTRTVQATSERFLVPRLADDIYPPKTHPYHPFPPRKGRTQYLLNNPRHPRATKQPAPSGDSRTSMLAYVDILSTPGVDTTGACLRLHFDNRHYIFGNLSEGTQRIVGSKRVSLARVENMFLTGPVDWQGHGGLMGFLLTIADVHESVVSSQKETNRDKAAKGKKLDVIKTVESVSIHGGKGLAHMLASARRFVFRKSFPLKPYEVRTDLREKREGGGEPDWADENVRVWYVPVHSERIGQAQGSSKSRKRKAEHMSDHSDGETSAPVPQRRETNGAEAEGEEGYRQDEIDQQMRLGVVKQMFNGKGPRKNQTVDALKEVKLGDVKSWETKYIRDEDGNLMPYNGPDDPEAMVLVRQSWKASDVPHLPPTEPAHVSLSYIVKLFPSRGKFNVALARELGVDKNDFKKLVQGQTVPGKDGMEVKPEMIVAPPEDPSGFILVEVPDASYIDGLLARPEWKDEKIMGGIAAMYWIVRTPEVLGDERILGFMREKSTMDHIVLSRTDAGSPCQIQGSAVELTRLNRISSELFPSLAHTDGDASSETPQDASLPYKLGKGGAQLRLKPKVAYIDDNVVVPAAEEEINARFIADHTILRLAEEARQRILDAGFQDQINQTTTDLPNPDTEVIPLGTGSAIPSRSRNVSCTLIRVPGIGSYLLDCGENSLGQLRRLYGFEGADAVVRDLKAIWISHSHADHHLGTVSVLKRFSQLVPLSTTPETQQKIALIAHPSYHHFLSEYSQLEPALGLSTHVTHLSNDTPTEPASPTNSFTKGGRRPLDDPTILNPFGLARVAICKVDHCDDARAVALTLTSGLKIAYSGDCRPSKEFALRVGQGAHLLIHEATLDDELVKDAVAKKHCTISEALWVAKRMCAKNVLLTHISQRYPKLPDVDSVPGNGNGSVEGGGGAEGPPVVFAFDFMRVKLGQFRAAREFLPALQRLYQEDTY